MCAIIVVYTAPLEYRIISSGRTMADEPFSELVAHQQHEAFLAALQARLSSTNFKVLHQELSSVLFTTVGCGRTCVNEGGGRRRGEDWVQGGGWGRMPLAQS